jgi:hypothetical protein
LIGGVTRRKLKILTALIKAQLREQASEAAVHTVIATMLTLPDGKVTYPSESAG